MKRLLLFVGLIIASCNDGRPEIDPYHPTRPADIPATTCDGTPIEWNWENQRSYNKGMLFLAKDSTGCVIAVIRKIR
jgi:hypothetical protein